MVFGPGKRKSGDSDSSDEENFEEGSN